MATDPLNRPFKTHGASREGGGLTYAKVICIRVRGRSHNHVSAHVNRIFKYITQAVDQSPLVQANRGWEVYICLMTPQLIASV